MSGLKIWQHMDAGLVSSKVAIGAAGLECPPRIIALPPLERTPFPKSMRLSVL